MALLRLPRLQQRGRLLPLSLVRLDGQHVWAGWRLGKTPPLHRPPPLRSTLLLLLLLLLQQRRRRRCWLLGATQQCRHLLGRQQAEVVLCHYLCPEVRLVDHS